MRCLEQRNVSGFTLIEVLLALAVVAIALTALLKATGQSVNTLDRIQEKTIYHWIMMQGIYEVQLKVIEPNSNQETTQVMHMFGKTWYWRVKLSSTPVKSMQQIAVSVSKFQHGPFTESLIAYRFHHEK